METPPSPSYVVFAFDATKEYSVRQLSLTIRNIRVRGDILCAGGTLIMLGVWHRVTHPMGFLCKPCPGLFVTSNRAIEEVISEKLEAYVNMLHQSAEEFEEQGVNIEVKITAGVPIKNVIIKEVETSKASWVVIDKDLIRELKMNVKQIPMPCKVALVQESFNVEINKHVPIGKTTEAIDQRQFYTVSKPVHVSYFHGMSESIDQRETPFRTNSMTSFLTSKSQDHSFPSKEEKSDWRNQKAF